jgi:hypothetical protein
MKKARSRSKILHILPGGSNTTGCGLKATRKIETLYEQYRDSAITCAGCRHWENLDSAQNFHQEALLYFDLEDLGLEEIESALLSFCQGGAAAAPFCEYTPARDMRYEFDGVQAGALRTESVHYPWNPRRVPNLPRWTSAGKARLRPTRTPPVVGS